MKNIRRLAANLARQRHILAAYPVKREYPGFPIKLTNFFNLPKGQFDIAIINKDCIKSNEDFKKYFEIQNDTFWCQPVKIAIQIKYSQLGQGINKSGFEEDLEKLNNYYQFHQKECPNESFYEAKLI